MSIFDQAIETDNAGMAGGTSHYDIEDLYQAFKERLIKEHAFENGIFIAQDAPIEAIGCFFNKTLRGKDMYKNKPVIIGYRPWWRNPVFPWGWYSIIQDNIFCSDIDGHFRPNDGGGGSFVIRPISKTDNGGIIFKQP